MDKTSEKIPQFGLIAEEVEKVDPDLVVRDEQGKVSTVRYEAVNVVLRNEFLKEDRKGEEQDATIRELMRQVEVLAAKVEKQALQLQKVSAQMTNRTPSPALVISDD